LLAFLRARAVPGVEEVTATSYRRFVRIGGHAGWVDVELDTARAGIVARIDTGLLPETGAIVTRLRALFDLDARPDVIDPTWRGILSWHRTSRAHPDCACRARSTGGRSRCTLSSADRCQCARPPP
jgi:hypothetical protein